jgi:signal transduction histidine kinase
VPDTLHTFVQANHFGLAGLAERASGEGGELQLSSQPGQGTVVTIILPS